MKKVLVLSDGKPGHYNQSFGIVKALETIEPLSVEKVDVKFRVKALRSLLKYLLKTKWSKPFFQKYSFLKYLSLFYAGDIQKDFSIYDYVVSTGGDTSFLNAWISAANPKTCSIYNGHPRSVDAEYFDVVTTVIDLNIPNQIILDVAPTTIEIDQKKDPLPVLHKLGLSPKRYYVLLIGGTGAGYRYSDEDMDHLIEGVNLLAKKRGISWLVTTSRRTDISHETKLKKGLEADYFVAFNEKPEKIMSDFLALADTVFVTEESSSMISEAIAAAKPVVTISPKDANPDTNYQNILAKFQKEKRIERTEIAALKMFEMYRENFNVIKESSSEEIAKKLKKVIKKDV